MKVLLSLCFSAFFVIAGPVEAATVNFNSDTAGFPANGFVSVDSALVSFSAAPNGSLELGDFGNQSFGNGLATYGASLVMNFTTAVTMLGLDFGNDDFRASSAGDMAWLLGYSGSTLVGTIGVLLNRDDIMNQTISFGNLAIDSALFYFGDSAGNFKNLSPVVDNVTFTVPSTVPLPATLPLLAMGMGAIALLRRKRLGAALH